MQIAHAYLGTEEQVAKAPKKRTPSEGTKLTRSTTRYCCCVVDSNVEERAALTAEKEEKEAKEEAPKPRRPNDVLDMRNDFLFTGMAVIRNQCYGMTSCGTGGTWAITNHAGLRRTFFGRTMIEDSATSLEMFLEGRSSFYVPPFANKKPQEQLMCAVPKVSANYLAALERWDTGAVQGFCAQALFRRWFWGMLGVVLAIMAARHVTRSRASTLACRLALPSSPPAARPPGHPRAGAHPDAQPRRLRRAARADGRHHRLDAFARRNRRRSRVRPARSSLKPLVLPNICVCTCAGRE